MDLKNDHIQISEIRDVENLHIIRTLAAEIFPQTYRGMIPDAQIPHMMHVMYDDDVLRKEFAGGMHFNIICDGDFPIGYICWFLTNDDGNKILRLEKLYLKFSCHGRGIGNMALNFVIECARNAEASFISLNVNKHNIKAQKAYRRAGFYFWRSEREPVGGGFFKDDYIMRFDVVPTPKINDFGFVRVADVAPEVLEDIRYYCSNNFVGRRVDGYEAPVALLTLAAAEALKRIGNDAKKLGLQLKIYDSYRPLRAVDDFMRWTQDPADTKTKSRFYPDLDKSELVPRGYILQKSAHTRGSTVALTLCQSSTGGELDMGGTFDWFGKESHLDWCGDPETNEYTGDYPGDTPPVGKAINETQFRNRMLLRKLMTERGFIPLAGEWWHFTLKGEPYPETGFDFPVK